MTTVEEVLKQTDEHMDKAIDSFKRDLSSIRTGRASPALLNNIKVEYYGTMTPLNQLATISAPEPRLLIIQPWDNNIIGEVEKAIMKSDLGLNPIKGKGIIRLPIPQLTQERRQELVRLIKKKAEDSRVAIRNIRRDSNEMIKKLEKNSDISEDERDKRLKEIQEKTDKKLEKIEEILADKEREILEF